MTDQKVLYHFLLVFSPLIFFFIFLLALLFDIIVLIDISISFIKGYAIFFIIVCSYIVFRYRNQEIKSKWMSFLIKGGYPIAASTCFAWLFLLPLMRQTVDMWDIQFLNMLVTLALGYFVFYFLIGLYHLISLPFQSKKVHS